MNLIGVCSLFSFIVVFVEKIVGGALQNFAQHLQIFELNATGLIIYEFIKVLIA